MAWIRKSQGIFKLHDSDNYCGSFISVDDAALILGVEESALRLLPKVKEGDDLYISELDIHREWGGGKIIGAPPSKIGYATRSFDELIVIKLIELTFKGCHVEPQIKFGRKYVDIKVTYKDISLFIEFMGPSHFIPQYSREIVSPFIRKKEVEDYFGEECIIWPYWIQRCTKNIKNLIQNYEDGLASVWSTKAYFRDFVLPNADQIIVSICKRFGAVKDDGIGYMYGNKYTNKPIHPIVQQIIEGKQSKNRLIPNGNLYPESFWLPEALV